MRGFKNIERYEELQEIWDSTPPSYTDERKLYALDEAACIETEIDLKLGIGDRYSWFYICMILTLHGYKKLGLLSKVSKGLLTEIQKHHCYIYKTDVVLDPDPIKKREQTLAYVKLRKKLRDELYGLLYRPGPSSE